MTPARRDKPSVHDSVVENRSPIIKPPDDGYPNTPFSEQPGIESYETRPLQFEDDYMMSGALGPEVDTRSISDAGERGRPRVLSHEANPEPHPPVRERYAAADKVDKVQPDAGNTEASHTAVTGAEYPTSDSTPEQEKKDSRLRSSSRGSHEHRHEHWYHYVFSRRKPDMGKYPMKSSKKQIAALKAQANLSSDTPMPIQEHLEPSTDPEPRTRPRNLRGAHSHSPPAVRPQRQQTRSTRSEERHAFEEEQPEWMPDMTDYEGSAGARYYWLDPEFISEKEEEQRYKQAEDDAALKLWETKFRGKGYVKPDVPVNGGGITAGMMSTPGFSALAM